MKQRKKIVGAFLCALLTGYSFSQELLWEKSYGGKQDDVLTDVIPTPDKGFIIAGSSVSNKTGNKSIINHGDFDYWIVKVDDEASIVW